MLYRRTRIGMGGCEGRMSHMNTTAQRTVGRKGLLFLVGFCGWVVGAILVTVATSYLLERTGLFRLLGETLIGVCRDILQIFALTLPVLVLTTWAAIGFLSTQSSSCCVWYLARSRTDCHPPSLLVCGRPHAGRNGTYNTNGCLNPACPDFQRRAHC